MRIFEPCAGMASVSLHAALEITKNPVAYRGSKIGYAKIICKILQARAPQEIWLNDPDDDIYRFWSSVAAGGAPDMIAHIKSWGDEPAQALWDRLQNTQGDDVFEAVKWAWMWGVAWPVGSKKFRGELRYVTPKAQDYLGAKTVSRLVAKYGRGPDGQVQYADRGHREKLSQRLAMLEGLPPITVTNHPASQIQPQAGWLVYVDPPYKGTQGYNHTFQRSDVLEFAGRWSDMGCKVCISEQEAMDLPGWVDLDITEHRSGVARVRTKSVQEYLTVNYDPGWPEEYLSFFGG